MKRFFPIIIGILAGTLSSGMIIYLNNNPVAFGEDNVSGWENYQAWTEENLSWKTIFSNISTPGKNLYKFVGANLIVKPESEAIKAVASIYNLTPQETEAAVNGSIAVLFNNTSTPDNLSLEQAYKMQSDIMADYQSLKELFDIQQEIDTSVLPTEMFANGDLQDSGFDLIYDLNVMEKILFDSVTDVTSGKPLSSSQGALKSFMDAVPVAKAPSPVIENKITIENKKAEIKVGDGVVEAPVLDEDVCPEDSVLDDSLDKFDKQNPPGSKNNPSPPASTGGTSDLSPLNDNKDSTSKVVPAKKAPTGGGFCGEIPDDPASPEFATLGGSEGPVAAAGAMGFSVKVALCLTVELVKEKAISSSSTSCVRCEVDKINEAFNKTLSHSMIPNKTTGNIFESATCKKSFGTHISFKVHLLPTPIPASPADDLIFGKNILAEWNKFVDRYKPFGGSKWDPDITEKFALTYPPVDITTDALVLSMEKSKADNIAKVKNDIMTLEIADEGTNMTLFSGPALDHMKEMTAFFKIYKNVFIDTITVCSDTRDKETLQ
ncbi:MAG: hypothetical protein PHP74_04820 [Candidatus Gracilibacteria bacterium]|nr:hypothetical protein [Candidatus Gracilibacteria bacterium]